MARIEKDREDLFAEATAFARRIALRIGSRIVLAGLRRNGALSIYFGQAFVLSFNETNELRRAYRDGILYRALADRRLGRLRRTRSGGGPVLHTSILSEGEEAGFLEFARRELQTLRLALDQRDYEVDGVVPTGGEARLRNEIAAKLQAILDHGVALADGL